MFLTYTKSLTMKCEPYCVNKGIHKHEYLKICKNEMKKEALSPTVSLYSKKFQIVIFSGRRRIYNIPNAYNICIYDTVSQPLKFFTTKFLSYNACV